jgi:hypothetical protein
MVYKAALGQLSSEYFDFLCQFSFHQLLHIHELSQSHGYIASVLITSLNNKLIKSQRHLLHRAVKGKLYFIVKLYPIPSIQNRTSRKIAFNSGTVVNCIKENVEIFMFVLRIVSVMCVLEFM